MQEEEERERARTASAGGRYQAAADATEVPPSTDRCVYSRRRAMIPGTTVHVPFEGEIPGKTFGAMSTAAAAELRVQQHTHERPASAPARRTRPWIV